MVIAGVDLLMTLTLVVGFTIFRFYKNSIKNCSTTEYKFSLMFNLQLDVLELFLHFFKSFGWIPVPVGGPPRLRSGRGRTKYPADAQDVWMPILCIHRREFATLAVSVEHFGK